MRRKLQLLLLLLLIAGTTETGMHASTDCERWMAAYKTELAHTKAVKKLAAAHARVKRLAQKKLANYVKKPSAPKPARMHFVRPRYTRQQMLDRFNIACGDLPGGPSLVEAKKSPAQFASEMRSYEPVEIANAGTDGIIPFENPPAYTPPSSNGGGSGGGGGYAPPFFGGGGGPGGGGGGGGTTPSEPIPPVPPIIPISPVPEPGSIVMILTGLAGAAGMVRAKLFS
jgi:uncharacterized membrane protein YgcG